MSIRNQDFLPWYFVFAYSFISTVAIWSEVLTIQIQSLLADNVLKKKLWKRLSQ